MTAMAAARLGYRTHILCPEADAPAAQVAASTTVAPFSDAAAVAWQSYQSTQGDLFGAMRHSKNARRLLDLPDLQPDVPLCLRQNVSPMVVEMKAGLVQPATGV